MKHISAALCIGLLATSGAAADDINRADLYVACIDYHNTKWKDASAGPSSHLNASQRAQLAPFQFKYMKQACDCTVAAAFELLSEATIQAYDKALNENGDGIILATDKASAEFKKTGMPDKQIACAEKGMDSSGYAQKLQELAK